MLISKTTGTAPLCRFGIERGVWDSAFTIYVLPKCPRDYGGSRRFPDDTMDVKSPGDSEHWSRRK